MAAQKRVTVSLKLTYHEEPDLIAWWNSVPRGSRTVVMKDMMRNYIEQNRGGYRPLLPRNVPRPFDPSRFTQLCDDTAWMRTALMDLPGYMERVLQKVAAAGGLPSSHIANGFVQGSDVSEEDAEKREGRLKKAKW